MNNDLYFKNKYYKYKIKYHKLKQSGGMFPVSDIDDTKKYYIKNVETGLYLRKTYANKTEVQTVEFDSNKAKSFEFTLGYANAVDSYRIQNVDGLLLAVTPDSKAEFKKNRGGDTSLVFKITKHPTRECYKIVNNNKLSLEIREGELKFDDDRDNSNKQCFIFEEAPEEEPEEEPAPARPPQPAPAPAPALKYNIDNGLINQPVLSQISNLPSSETPQIKSAMVWGALNRANEINGITEFLRLKYITHNDVMKNGNPDNNPATCQFIKDYVRLSEDPVWVQATKQTLGL